MPRQVGALINDAVVPEQAEPLQTLEDRAGALLGAASLVGVLDAQQKLAAELFGVEPVEQRCARTTDVQISRRRRSEAKSRFGGVGHD